MDKIIVMIACPIILSIICFATGWAMGWNSGKKKAEDSFCDKFLREATSEKDKNL